MAIQIYFKYVGICVFCTIFLIGLFPLASASLSNASTIHPATPQSRIINHACANISVIPEAWVTTVQNTLPVQYCHRSHGGQLLNGVNLLAADNSTLSVNISTDALPSQGVALCILDGQATGDNYITPEMYWSTPEGRANTAAVIATYPVKVSMWAWCTELDSWSADDVDAYLTNMSAFEATYPNITFVYMTGNAQATGDAGYNRAQRNAQIRDYCIAHDKWLFDFEDLDAWCGSAFNSYSYNSTNVPLQHAAYNCPDCDVHVNEAASRVKGAAFWWLLARIAGWDGTTYVAAAGPANAIPGFPIGTLLLVIVVSIGLSTILFAKSRGKSSALQIRFNYSASHS